MAFVGLLFFIGPGVYLNHPVMHDYPYGYFASDAFQHQIRAEAIKDIGNFRYEAKYISMGFEDVVGRYPPASYHIAAILSYATGMEVYDTFYFLIFFLTIDAIALMYLIIRNFNRYVALISIPLAIIVFSLPPVMGFTWGHWPSVAAQAMMIAFFWSIMRLDLDKAYLLVGIAFASVIMIHTSEAVFGAIFILMFLAIRFAGKSITKNQIKNLIIGLVIAFVLTLYYVIIFKNTWAKTQPYYFFVKPIWEGNPGFYIGGFGLLLVFIIAGIFFVFIKNYRNYWSIIGILYILSIIMSYESIVNYYFIDPIPHVFELHLSIPIFLVLTVILPLLILIYGLKEMHVSFILGFSMLLGGFLNYAGFDFRSFQIRFFWPLYLAVFFGFGTYMLLKLVVKEWKLAYSVVVFMLVSVILLLPINSKILPSYNGRASEGLMNLYHWNLIKWLSQNTEKDAKIYFFYGDIYSQDALLRNSKRMHYQVDPYDFIRALQDKKIKREYVTELPGDGGGSLSSRKGIFDFQNVLEGLPRDYSFGPKDICTFDYLIFDKVSRPPVLAQYNWVVASEMLKNDYVKNVYENEVAVILKNNKPGEDCIEERSI